MIKPDKIIFSKRKTLGLQINKDELLIVRAPIGTSQKRIDMMLKKYENWIVRKKEFIKEHKHIPKKYVNGEKFMLLGKSYPLEIIKEDSLRIYFDDKFYLTDKAIPYGKKLFTLFYKRNTLKIVKKQCEYYATHTNLHYNKVSVTLAETRWGSCSYKNNINFSYRLVMAPFEIIDYVVVHELAHIIEKNHSPDFWKIVQTIIPDYKERRKWLRKNDRFLQL